MADRVLLHVGSPKTGTSFLETILWSQPQQLKRDGIWMPGRSRRAHDALMGEVRGGAYRHQDPRWTWPRVAEAAATRDGTVLISKEMLAGATREQAAVALDALHEEEVHIVITVRQLGGLLPSFWQQSLKARSVQTLDQWLNGVRTNPQHGFWTQQDPLSVLAAWADGLPAAQVHVVTMPTTSADPTVLWRRFATVLGVDPSDYRIPEAPNNTSMGSVQAELLRRVNAELGQDLPWRTPYLDGVRDQLTRPMLVGRATGPRGGLGPEHHDWVTERSAQIIAGLEQLPCTLVGDLEDLRPQLAATSFRPEELPESEIAAEAVRALAGVLTLRQS